jgi:hypothetical protein
MNFRTFLAAGAAATTLFAAGAADAALVFVSSWELTDGPADYGPLSGQQAAALLFGGNASDYVISTAGEDVADIDFQAWYLGEAFPGAAINRAQDATNFLGDITAYGFDPEVAKEASRFVNYAFRDDGLTGSAPEPATWALMIAGFGLAGAGLRRRRAALG